ncbi:hypothetical protein E2320_000433, partial [Naja naja]
MPGMAFRRIPVLHEGLAKKEGLSDC